MSPRGKYSSGYWLRATSGALSATSSSSSSHGPSATCDALPTTSSGRSSHVPSATGEALPTTRWSSNPSHWPSAALLAAGVPSAQAPWYHDSTSRRVARARVAMEEQRDRRLSQEVVQQALSRQQEAAAAASARQAALTVTAATGEVYRRMNIIEAVKAGKRRFDRSRSRSMSLKRKLG